MSCAQVWLFKLSHMVSEKVVDAAEGAVGEFVAWVEIASQLFLLNNMAACKAVVVGLFDARIQDVISDFAVVPQASTTRLFLVFLCSVSPMAPVSTMLRPGLVSAGGQHAVCCSPTYCPLLPLFAFGLQLYMRDLIRLRKNVTSRTSSDQYKTGAMWQGG